MPDFDDIPPEQMQRLMQDMQRREYEGLTPEQAEERRRRKEEEKRANIACLSSSREIFAAGRYSVNGTEIPLTDGNGDFTGVKVYLPETALPAVPDGLRCDTKFSCRNADSLSLAAEKFFGSGETCTVLNLASASRPGGAVNEGANGQEESLCRSSTLLMSLESEAAGEYYRYNKSYPTRLGTDAVMVSPRVRVFRGENGELLEKPFDVSVISCSAPMIRMGLEGKTQDEYAEMLYNRILRILGCAAAEGYRHLILGAFGCGVFGNDAAAVSSAFDRALRGPMCGVFEDVDFAVLCRGADDYNFAKFCEHFGESE